MDSRRARISGKVRGEMMTIHLQPIRQLETYLGEGTDKTARAHPPTHLELLVAPPHAQLAVVSHELEGLEVVERDALARAVRHGAVVGDGNIIEVCDNVALLELAERVGCGVNLLRIRRRRAVRTTALMVSCCCSYQKPSGSTQECPVAALQVLCRQHTFEQ